MNDIMKKLIEEITDLEWDMFSSVENQGGKASCQSRPVTFNIMRSSQLKTWSAEILMSYRNDLLEAKQAGRNLCTEKYGYMMESTVPKEYEKIKPFLPVTDEKTMELIREIVAINLDWEKTVDEQYPNLRANGRPLYREQDTPVFTSVETYLTGELKTYSPATIRLLYDYTLACRDQGRNLAKDNLEIIVLSYGYASLEEAES